MAVQGNSRLFDGYIAVDWSGARNRTRGRNSIWVAVDDGHGQVQFMNPRTRHDAMVCIQEPLDEATKAGRRLLCGFDFAFGYPEGTARMMADGNNWQAVWALMPGLVNDQLNNQNSALQAAAQLNNRFQGEGPFWGINLPNGAPQGIPGRIPHNRWGVNLPPYRRHIERMFPGLSVWQVSGPGAVGLQSLTGIARLQVLRQGRGDVQVWPFETLGEGWHHVLAEIYPSLILPSPGYAVRDQAQVHAVAVRLSQMDEVGTLAQRLQIPSGMPDAVRNEEALFLDIT